MILAVVRGAQRHGKLVADFERKATGLRIAHVMGMRRVATADEAGLLGHKAKVLERTRLGSARGEQALVDLHRKISR